MVVTKELYDRIEIENPTIAMQIKNLLKDEINHLSQQEIGCHPSKCDNCRLQIACRF